MQSIPIVEIASAVGGQVLGRENIEVSGAQPLRSANLGDITFFAPSKSSQHQDYLKLARETKAEVLLIQEHDPSIPCTQIIVRHPYVAMTIISEIFWKPKKPAWGIHSTAVIDSSAKISEKVHVGAYSVIGARCIVGEGVVIHPHVVLYDDVRIGDGSEIHAGAVIREAVSFGKDCLMQPGVTIGGDGFGYLPDPELGHRRIPHIGTVEFADRVDVGTNGSVDRGTFGKTRVGTATKIDSLVQIGHNNQIGERTLICGGCGIAGSVTIGNDSILAGQVGVADHVVIGDRVRVAAQSGVGRDVESGQDIAGSPMPSPIKDFWRELSAVKKLPSFLTRIRKMEKTLDKMKDQLEKG